MSEYNNRGILFRNFRKKLPKHPDCTGEATIDGRKYKIAGWIKQGKKSEFHSLAFTEEQSETPPSPQTTESADISHSTDDDIPF